MSSVTGQAQGSEPFHVLGQVGTAVRRDDAFSGAGGIERRHRGCVRADTGCARPP